MNRAVVLGFALSVAYAGTALAQKLTDVRISDAKGGAQKTAFKPDVAKVFVSARPQDIPAGKKLRCDWIAVKTRVAPPNYKIDSWQGESKAGMDALNCSLSRPTSGWPEGDYRVDLFVDGKDAGRATFKVAK